MCQAYEGEARSIASGESFWRRAGWRAFKEGEPFEACPAFLMPGGYNREAWEHGWRYAKECQERGEKPLWPEGYE